MSEDHPPSPCTKVCTIDPVTTICRGCMRTLAEISAWFSAGAEDKRAILRAVATRQTGLQSATSGPNGSATSLGE